MYFLLFIEFSFPILSKELRFVTHLYSCISYFSMSDLICTQCCPPSKPFSQRKNLLRHLRDKHQEAGAEVCKILTAKPDGLECPNCGNVFCNHGNLKRHMEKFHQMETEEGHSLILCQEEDCNWKGNRQIKLREHLESEHNLQFETVEDRRFNTKKDFEDWCYEIENREEASHFIEKQGAWKTKEGHMRRVRECSRSGIYDEAKYIPRGKKRHKGERGGTTRIGHRCTQQIVYLELEDGSILVKDCCLTHYGHDISLAHVLMGKIDK